MKVFMDVCRISFSLVGWVDSHKGGPDLIPADGMARGLTYPVAPEQIIVAAKSLFTCCVSFHAAAFVWPLLRRADPYQREGWRVLSAHLTLIQRRAHPGLVIVKRLPCLASLPQGLRAAAPPQRAVVVRCLSWRVV